VSGEPPPSGRARYSFSPSQVVAFDLCERSWYLASVARAPDDSNAGGQYLLQGDLFDAAVGRHQARMDLYVEDLVGEVRAKPGLRGAALDTPPEKWAELAERAQRMLRAVEHHLPAPKTARLQHRYRVPVPGFESVGGVVLSGKADLRLPGLVVDTKSTTDRGPGRGRDAHTPPFALTDESTPGGNVRPLANDVQARLYAWAEFQLDPLRLSVRCRWVYASKPSSGSPQGWAAEHVFLRADTLAWFESYARPRFARMVQLHEASEIELAPGLARANHESCLRCFRRLSCDPYSGAQVIYPGALVSKAAEIRARQAAAALAASAGAPPAPPTLEDQLRASVASLPPAVTGLGLAPQGLDGSNVVVVGVNRPNAPPNPALVETTGVDVTPPATPRDAAPAVALREEMGEELALAEGAPKAPAGLAAGAEAAASATAAEPEPRRGRGRPRKPRAAEAPTPEAESAAGTYDPAAAATAKTRMERISSLENIATALQAVADSADSAVQVVNAELRALGVRL